MPSSKIAVICAKPKRETLLTSWRFGSPLLALLDGKRDLTLDVERTECGSGDVDLHLHRRRIGIFVAFHSVRDALLVMSNLPLALIGGVAGVWLEGGVLSVASLVGFITLFGIATRNGIMLVSHIRHLVREEGVSTIDEAVRRGATERLVPILMTALAAGVGLVPLALAAGKPGSEIQAPLAIVILCGLLSSTILNMFVVPALYRRFGALGRPSRGLLIR